MVASWYNNGLAQFVYVVVWAFVVMRLTPYYLRLVDRIEGAEVDTPSQLPALSDHEIRKAIQDTGRMLREAGALQGETFLTDDGEEQQQQQQKEVAEMRRFRVHIRPFTGSVTVFDYEQDVGASPKEWETLFGSQLLDGDDDSWNVAVFRYGGGIHGFQIITVKEPTWPLWLSEVLSDKDLAVVADTIKSAMGEYENVLQYLNGTDKITWKHTCDISLEVK